MADYESKPPVEQDLRVDDQDYNVAVEPKSAKAWLNLLQESEDAFESWNAHCDKIDRQYASNERLSSESRNREFQMFWANSEVIKPAIYARPPIPVVMPKFQDRRPVYQAASEVLERCATVAFDLAHIYDCLKLIRDDVALIGRGVAWCRYEAGGGDSYYDFEKVCIDYKHRRDFLHSISRCWYEVTWVAAASYLTRSQARERFHEHSGNAYREAEYMVDKDSKEIGGADSRERAKFWEIWHKTERRVVWVANGCEDILDEADPHLKLQDFFPCPCPAYGCLQRGSLVPVPDIMQYRDQLDEVNLLTGRIHALSDAVEAKGFYPSGGAELSEAIQAAMKIKEPGRVLVPISDWAAFGGTKEVIVWLPIAEISQTINTLVELRKQVIEDIYQIMGLSDIMRGATDARETLGAQNLKAQYGSTRIKDKQLEMARIARDLVHITSQIITQEFADDTIIEMAQSQLPTEDMQQKAVMGIQQQMQQITQQIQMAAQSPQGQQLQQQNPEQAQQMMGQAQGQLQQMQGAIQEIATKPTIEQVLAFLKDNKTKAFVLDIETDSTIMVNEQAEKQGRAEFLQMLSPVLQQLSQMLVAAPETADFCGQILKFAVAPYRAGRELDGAIDDLAEQMKEKGGQPKGDDPTTATNKTALQIEQLKQQRQAEKDKADIQLKQQELQMKDEHEKMKLAMQQQIEMSKAQQKQQDDAAKAHLANTKAQAEREKSQMEILGKQHDMQLNEQKAGMMQAAQQAKQQDMAARGAERAAAAQAKQQPSGFGP